MPKTTVSAASGAMPAEAPQSDRPDAAIFALAEECIAASRERDKALDGSRPLKSAIAPFRRRLLSLKRRKTRGLGSTSDPVLTRLTTARKSQRSASSAAPKAPRHAVHRLKRPPIFAESKSSTRGRIGKRRSLARKRGPAWLRRREPTSTPHTSLTRSRGNSQRRRPPLSRAS